LKKNPRYLQIGLGLIMGPPMDVRLMGGWGVPCSCEVKDFGFVVFHNEASVDKDF